MTVPGSTSAVSRAISFTISAEDYVNAVRLRLRRKFYRARPRFAIFVAIVLVALGLACVVTGWDNRAVSVAIGGTIGVVAVIGWAALVYSVLLPKHARRIYARQKTLQHPVDASWSAKGYAAATAVASSMIPWGDYHGWSADDTTVLLLQSPVLFQMIPTHALSVDQRCDLIAHVEQSGLQKI